MSSIHSSPSTLMVTPILAIPLGSGTGPTAVTVPETELWILADTKPEDLAINCPTFTLSPFCTIMSAGLPMCCAAGMYTVSGMGITLIG